MMKIIQHSKNRFEVTGMIYSDVIRGKMEKYSRCHSSKRAAVIDRDKWQRINVRNAEDHAEIAEIRRKVLLNYLAERAERQNTKQLALF